MSQIMMDFVCTGCGSIGEELVEPGTKVLTCSCGQPAVQIWMKAPGVGNKMKGKFPYFDKQLGMSIDSPKQREQIAKAKGLTILSNEEFKRSENNHHSEPENYIDREKWRESAQKAWQDIKSQAVPLAPATSMDKVDATPIGTNT